MHNTNLPLLLTRLALGILLAVTCALAGCQASNAGDDVFVVADLFATPGKAIATIELSPTPSPTATIPNFPTPTPGPTRAVPTAVLLQRPTQPIAQSGATPTRDISSTATPTPIACPSPPPPFTGVWDRLEEARTLLRCPVGEPVWVDGVIQGYEHGVMFWVRETTEIIVMSEVNIQQHGQATDTWWLFRDLYTGDQPEDPGLVPPEGLIQPVRGFGYVWRNNAFVRDALGWAVTYEMPMQSLWQDFENGWMMAGIDQSTIYVLVPLDEPPHTTGLHFGSQPP